MGEVTPSASVQKTTVPAASKQDVYAGKTCMTYMEPSLSLEQLSAIPEFAKLGPLFKSSDKPVELTESETEYVVRCIKHTFLDYIVFQVSQL